MSSEVKVNKNIEPAVFKMICGFVFFLMVLGKIYLLQL